MNQEPKSAKQSLNVLGLTPEQIEAREAYCAQMAAKCGHDEKEAVARKVAELRSTWNAPARQLKTVVRHDEKYARWADTFDALKSSLGGSGFLSALIGGNGPGKTQMAVELMRHATSRLISSFYDTATGFFINIKDTFDGGSEKTVIADYVRPKFLVIDEFEKRGATDWHQNLLFHVFDRRYADMKDTLIIANCTDAEFSALIGKSLASRMKETGGLIQCNWGSFR